MNRPDDRFALYGLVESATLSWALNQPAFCRWSTAEITAKIDALKAGGAELVWYRVLTVNVAGRVEVVCWASSWATRNAPDRTVDPKRELVPGLATETEGVVHLGPDYVVRHCELCGTPCYVMRLIVDKVLDTGLAGLACWTDYRSAGYRDIQIHSDVIAAVRATHGPAATEQILARFEQVRAEIREWLAEKPEPVTLRGAVHSLFGPE